MRCVCVAQPAPWDAPALPLVPRSLRERDYGTLDKSQYSLFIKFFRQASPYIEGHRGRTFVLAIPGEVSSRRCCQPKQQPLITALLPCTSPFPSPPAQLVDRKDILHNVLEDVGLLHGLGVKLVIVVGARMQINQAIRARGSESQYAGGYRVTDEVAMEAAVAAAGIARMEVEARLSKGPAVTMVRRHARAGSGGSGGQPSYVPAVCTVSGNYTAAKRKGVVNGVDYQHTGVVRFVQSGAIRRQLDAGNVVLLSNLGYSAAGEVLNCDIFTVAVRAAVDLGADKLIVMTGPEAQSLDLPAWLSLTQAERILTDMAVAAPCGNVQPAELELLRMPSGAGAPGNGNRASANGSSGSSSSSDEGSGNGHSNGNGNGGSAAGGGFDLDFDRWYELGLPMPLVACCMACRAGVKRAHLVDGRMDGSLVLELYSRDGVGVMISGDFFEGIRRAVPADLEGIQELLAPLVERGILVPRTREQLQAEVPHFTVVEQEQQLLACATMKPLGRNARGELTAEVGAVCVHPDYRGGGRGDSLLQYLEEEARAQGVEQLLLLTTRTADWFEQRGFALAGPAHLSQLLPEDRRTRVKAERNSQLYSKDLRR